MPVSGFNECILFEVEKIPLIGIALAFIILKSRQNPFPSPELKIICT